eukprot:7067885-Ditylum_brightwellii.AAC.1
MSLRGVRRGCGCKGLAGICFEALEEGMRATIQPRPWNNFFQGVDRDLSELPISINILEYITVILNHVASTVAVNNLRETGVNMLEHVLVFIKADNTAAECWAKKASSSS